jgi:Ferritin-like
VILLRRELATGLGGPDRNAVLAALQSALELEHSTIPPYLYALYSLVPGANKAVAEIIESVVIEEMLHITLASNVLNALGGSPVLDRPDIIPHYPGPLPGSVESGLVVGLAPFSIDLVGKVFMKIEEPEEPLRFRVELAETEEPITIGEFYERIKASIVALGDGAFTPVPRHQIGPDRMDHSVVVTDVESASRAIDTIVEQGEGTRTTPLEIVGTDYAHYYRFGEIFRGRRLIPNAGAGPDAPPDQRYVYGGDPVAFDPDGVLAVPTNPTLAGYPTGSLAFLACRTFNYTYTNLLKVLHVMLNGTPNRLDDAIGLMMSLRQQAKDMATGAITGGMPVGPSFEYQPING